MPYLRDFSLLFWYNESIKIKAVFPCIGAPNAALLLPVISLLDGHSLVKVLCLSLIHI